MDEATASEFEQNKLAGRYYQVHGLTKFPSFLLQDIDLHTDRLIQTAIRSETGLFASSTVLCIAHRLSTVIDFDRIMVLDSGKLVEYGTPWELLQKPNGWFRSMVHETGPDAEEMLRKIAEDKETERLKKVGQAVEQAGEKA